MRWGIGDGVEGMRCGVGNASHAAERASGRDVSFAPLKAFWIRSERARACVRACVRARALRRECVREKAEGCACLRVCVRACVHLRVRVATSTVGQGRTL